VAERTERVYDYAASKSIPSTMVRIKTALAWGSVVGLYALFFTIIEAMIMMIIEIFWPSQDICVAPFSVAKEYTKDPTSLGDHLFKLEKLLPQTE